MDEFISDDRTHQKILEKKRKSHIFKLSGYENAIKETGSVNPSNFSSDLQKKIVNNTCRIFLGFEFLVRNEKKNGIPHEKREKTRKTLPHKMMIIVLQIYERLYF